ncbi:MAG: bifunctional riboflavin kinase/FAD synthetase [Lachnospiraceae bacterium]|nr:bifunctional riboflavin kinase/FAD synthetase [Lachnospiraceae bacterium]
MKVITNTLDFHIEGRSVITLGKFDGVHRGHQALIQRVLDYKKGNAKKIVFAFEVSAMTLLTREERRDLLKKMGVDCLIECPFVPELITMEAEDFVKEILVDQLHAVHIVVGTDFGFGYERGGNIALLERMGKEYGFTVESVEKVMDGEREISSTYIREELERGNMAKVSELLGYPFFVTGEVVHGRRVGRTIGVPTTNLIPPKEKLLPPNGVYATKSSAQGIEYEGITNIGSKPTVNGHFIGVETFLFGCDQDLYGEEQEVRLYHFMRPERKFDSLELLKEQLKKDEENGHIYFR